LKRYEKLMSLFKKNQKQIFYEANVGAGLPIIQTLKDLVATGDTIVSIEGTMSGTLSFLFNNFDGTKPFSQLVHDAQQLGYTEPDPREDISGNDVARKLLILAREIGLKMDLRDIHVQSLVPPSLRKGKFTNNFYSRFAEHDDAMLRQLAEARKDNSVLRYVGTLRDGKAVARLQTFPQIHPLASARGSESIFVFTTKRYAQLPLVVRGHGAGAQVTAMGVFSDILKLLNTLT
jgi:aspartokinase/homoserine dehydrogenase 1